MSDPKKKSSFSYEPDISPDDGDERVPNPADYGPKPLGQIQEEKKPSPVQKDASVALDEALDAAGLIDKRLKLRFVQFKMPTRISPSQPTKDALSHSEGRCEIYVEEVAGIPCVTCEGPDYRVKGYVPLAQVAAFALL